MGGTESCYSWLRPDTPEVLVVGAGPAGISAVVALRQHGRRILWVDPDFASGRLQRFKEVPCNTKVDILVSPQNFGHPLLNDKEVNVSRSLERLKETAHDLNGSVDPSKLGWTTLGCCQDVYLEATGQLLPSVPHFRGKVVKLKPMGNGWEATLEAQGGRRRSVQAAVVVLATGAEPKMAESRLKAASKALSVEVTFQKEQLTSALASQQRVAVLGNSHSAAVALAKLGELAEPLKLRVGCFGRRPLRCAEWIEERQCYRYTSTGLKGFGAVFGRDCMVQGTTWLEVKDVKEFDESQWDWVVDCTGYEHSSFPPIEGVDESKLVRDEASGRLGDLPLYGVGVPWGEPPGRFWGKGLEHLEGFKGETTFVGFSLFMDRAILIAAEIQRHLSSK